MPHKFFVEEVNPVYCLSNPKPDAVAKVKTARAHFPFLLHPCGSVKLGNLEKLPPPLVSRARLKTAHFYDENPLSIFQIPDGRWIVRERIPFGAFRRVSIHASKRKALAALREMLGSRSEARESQP